MYTLHQIPNLEIHYSSAIKRLIYTRKYSYITGAFYPYPFSQYPIIQVIVQIYSSSFLFPSVAVSGASWTVLASELGASCRGIVSVFGASATGVSMASKKCVCVLGS